MQNRYSNRIWLLTYLNVKQMQNAKQVQNAKQMQNRMKSHLPDLFCILRFAPQKSYKKIFKQNLVINLSK